MIDQLHTCQQTKSWEQLMEKQPPLPKDGVEALFRKKGWVPPSIECEETKRKHMAFRSMSTREAP